jgi:hypothetical protein
MMNGNLEYDDPMANILNNFGDTMMTFLLTGGHVFRGQKMAIHGPILWLHTYEECGNAKEPIVPVRLDAIVGIVPEREDINNTFSELARKPEKYIPSGDLHTFRRTL